jgi:hypothetical protein
VIGKFSKNDLQSAKKTYDSINDFNELRTKAKSNNYGIFKNRN